MAVAAPCSPSDILSEARGVRIHGMLIHGLALPQRVSFLPMARRQRRGSLFAWVCSIDRLY